MRKMTNKFRKMSKAELKEILDFDISKVMGFRGFNEVKGLEKEMKRRRLSKKQGK